MCIYFLFFILMSITYHENRGPHLFTYPKKYIYIYIMRIETSSGSRDFSWICFWTVLYAQWFPLKICIPLSRCNFRCLQNFSFFTGEYGNCIYFEFTSVLVANLLYGCNLKLHASFWMVVIAFSIYICCPKPP